MSEKQIMAKVEGVEISKDDVMNFIRIMADQGHEIDTPDRVKMACDELVNQELISHYAVDENYEEEEQFQKILDTLKTQALRQYAVDKIMVEIEVSEDEMRKFYEEEKEKRFKVPNYFEAAHIVVEDEKLAEELFKRIEDGESFEDLAKEYSECPSKENGGHLGRFIEGQMVPEFDQALKEMEVDSISEPVKTQFGYHIIRLDNKADSGYQTFDQVKDEIKQVLEIKKQQDAYLNFSKSLEEKYDVEKFY